MKNSGEQFLHKINPKLHTSEFIEHEKYRKDRLNEETSQKPADKIADFLKVIEHTHTGHRDDPRVVERIKDYYYKKYVIKPEDIPEGYYENQKRMAKELGHGDIEITDALRKQNSEIVITDQESTLDNWINYFTSPDSDVYPMWVKYWAFNGMTKLSTFNKEKHEFAKRDKGTVAPFPDINREALAYVVDVIVKKANEENIPQTQDNQEFKKILDSNNFGKLYAYAIEKVTPTKKNELLNTEGNWIKYPKGSDHMPLVESLQGYGTGWCTAGESTAKTQLENGDFYVYYSNNNQGESTVPRVAIRMQGNSIGEIRGVASQQNLDPYIGDVVDKKLDDFSDKDLYKKKTADMKKLTEIDNKNTKNEELTKEDLQFLYELDSKIYGFGYRRDPRIVEILSKRDMRADLSFVTGYSKEQISFNEEEAYHASFKHFSFERGWTDGIVFHYGDLKPDLRTDGFTSDVVYHGRHYKSFESLKEVKLPETMIGNLYLPYLESAEGLILPKTINGNIYLDRLESVKGINFPEKINGDLRLTGLESADGLKLPETINGDLYLGLKSADSLDLPETINFGLSLSKLTSTKGLRLPKTINGDLNLMSLKSAEGLKLPETIKGELFLSGLISADNLNLPEKINGDLILNGLKSAKGLKLPETMSGDLILDGLTSAEGLKLPETIYGNLFLRGLVSAEGLILPKTIHGSLYLKEVNFAERYKLKEKYPLLNIVY